MPFYGKLPKLTEQEADPNKSISQDTSELQLNSPQERNVQVLATDGVPRLINNITFFGDSAIPEQDPIYKDVWNCARELAIQKFSIVNGGGPGIMKAATDGAIAGGGNTIAVYWEPKLATYFEGKNLANVTAESEGFSNYMMRTLGLIEKGDAFVVCKGGTGTISELGMVWCLAKLYYGCHKPVILYGDFWDELIESIQKAMIIDEVELGVLYQANSPEQVLSILSAHETKIRHCNFSTNSDERAFVLTPRTMQTVAGYNQYASSYHAEHAGKLEAQDLLDEFMQLVKPPAKVLDIGTGPGYDAKYLSTKYAVTGIEPALKFAELAKYENPDMTVLNADIVTFELPENSYKGIWARDSLHHIGAEDLDAVFAKLAAALVPGGILYTVVREGEGEITTTSRKAYGDLERFYHLFTVDELLERARKAGLNMHAIRQTKRSHSWLIGIFTKPV